MFLEPQYAHLFSSLDVVANYVPQYWGRWINSLGRYRDAHLPRRSGTGPPTCFVARQCLAVWSRRGASEVYGCLASIRLDAMAGVGPAGAHAAVLEGALLVHLVCSRRGVRRRDGVGGRRMRIGRRYTRRQGT